MGEGRGKEGRWSEGRAREEGVRARRAEEGRGSGGRARRRGKREWGKGEVKREEGVGEGRSEEGRGSEGRGRGDMLKLRNYYLPDIGKSLNSVSFFQKNVIFIISQNSGAVTHNPCLAEFVSLTPGVDPCCVIRRIEKPRIMLLDCSLEYKKGESQVGGSIDPTQIHLHTAYRAEHDLGMTHLGHLALWHPLECSVDCINLITKD